MMRMFMLLPRRKRLLCCANAINWLRTSSTSTTHEVVGTKGTNSSSSNSSSSSVNKYASLEEKYLADKHAKQAFRQYFRAIWANPSKLRRWHHFTRDFIQEFNYSIEKKGFTITSDASWAIKIVLWFIASIFAVPLLTVLLPESQQMTREHQQIIDEEETVNLKRFMRDYLSSGQVQSIVCYPHLQRAVAFMAPDAVVKGEEFIGTGVNIDVDDDDEFINSTNSKLKPAEEFIQRIREAEKQLGFEGRTEIVVKANATFAEKFREVCRVFPTYCFLLVLLMVPHVFHVYPISSGDAKAVAAAKFIRKQATADRTIIYRLIGNNAFFAFVFAILICQLYGY